MKVLLLNQTFYPDVMATAQYLSDLAVALAEHGHDVTVICSRRAYDQPERCFPPQETWRGVKIRRIPTSAFGKQAKWRRAADFASFIFSCGLRLLITPRPEVVVALTSPPLISFLGAVFARWRGAKFVYWVMDLNPDEAIAAGWLREGSLAARFLHGLSRFSFRRAQKIIALDRFMQQRIAGKGIVSDKIAVIPPWSHDAAVRFDPAGRARFRAAHGLTDKFVVMYSGNHSPCHPLDTLLAAARELASDPRFVFLFVGGGSEWRKIQEQLESGKQKAEMTAMAEDRGRKTERGARSAERDAEKSPNAQLRTPNIERRTSNIERRTSNAQHPTSNVEHPTSNVELPTSNAELPTSNAELPTSNAEHPTSNAEWPSPTTPPLTNLLCLPYQPLDQLSGSLSAADLHVVLMGDLFVGVIHPCKIYNILSVGAPVLYVGPTPSHGSEILGELASPVCRTVAHGEVARCVAEIRRLAVAPARGEPERYAAANRQYSQATLLPRLVAELERL